MDEERKWRQPWTPQEDALLGTMIDKKVARRLGRRPEAVAQRRRELGIPAFRARPARAHRAWSAAEDALLGTMTDKDLAAQLGCSTAEVFNRRRKLNVAPYCHGRPTGP